MKTFHNLLLEMSKKVVPVVSELIPVPEGVQRHYEHIGDAHFNDGQRGALSIANSLEEILTSPEKHLGTKIEGSPSMEYGMEGGKHWISYKGSGKRSFSHEDIEIHHPLGSQGFRDAMHGMMDHVGKIFNGKEGEVHQGDVMWHEKQKPSLVSIEGVEHYSFKPNVIRNAVPADSDEGRKISQAKFGFAPHTAYRNGESSNLTSRTEKQHDDVHLVDTSAPSFHPNDKAHLQKQIIQLHKTISDTPNDHFEYISQPNVASYLKMYTSSKRSTETQHNIGFDDFHTFVSAKLNKGVQTLKTEKGKIKKQEEVSRVLADFTSNRQHIESGLKVHTAITNIGNNIRSSLDTQHDMQRYFDTDTGLQKTNVEGYVFKPTNKISHSWYKIVDPTFTARNANFLRPPRSTVQESVEPSGNNPLERTGVSTHAVVSFGRMGLGHSGHMALASSVITHAKENNADSYVIISRKTGPNDPLTVAEKIDIHHTVFSENKSVFQATTDEMPSIIEVLQNLHKHGYKNVTVVAGEEPAVDGEDQKKAFEFVKKYNGKFNKETGNGYQFDNIDVISRQETNDPSKDFVGPRATDMRNTLMDPSKSHEEQYKVWRDGMHPNISDEKVKELISTVKTRLSSHVKKKKIAEQIISNILRYIAEEGEGGVAAGMTTNSGIAGLGDDAREGNVVVRKRPNIFRRKRRRI